MGLHIWVILGLVGIFAIEIANRVKGEAVVIDGKRVGKYILMLAGGVFTLLYAVYYLFTVSPITFDDDVTHTDTDDEKSGSDEGSSEG